MARKIAPTLTEMVSIRATATDDDVPWKDAYRELRALIAVARAARGAADAHRSCIGPGCEFGPVFKALARLDKACGFKQARAGGVK